MIRISSENELRAAFRPIDAKELFLPGDLSYPIVLRDYMAWIEPSGHRVFLLFQDPNGLGARGIVFRRSHSSSSGTVQMCQWCHSVRGGNSVRLLTAANGTRKRIGMYLCQDLSCKEKVLGSPGVDDLREPYSRYEKLYRVLLKMSDFARQDLYWTMSDQSHLH